MVETNVLLHPSEEDGILQTFIDRYTTMLVKDSIFMEEIPAPHFMHQSLLNHPIFDGHHFEDRDHVSELVLHGENDENREVTLSLEELLKGAVVHPYGDYEGHEVLAEPEETDFTRQYSHHYEDDSPLYEKLHLEDEEGEYEEYPYENEEDYYSSHYSNALNLQPARTLPNDDH